MKKIIITFLSLLFLFNLNSFAQKNNPRVKKMLNEYPEYTYLADFTEKLSPGTEARFSVVLSQNTIYSLSVFQEKKNQFSIELFKTDSKKDMVESLSKIQINDNSTNLVYKIKNTGAYDILIKNTSSKTANSHVLLSFVNRLTNNEPEEEVIAITSQGKSQKEKDFFEGKDKESKTEEIFFVVEEMPKFKGKNPDEFKKYLNSKIQYPQEAIDKKIEGRLFVQFTVGKDGYIKDAKIARGIHPALDQEALRIVYSSPRWTPGKQRGQNVNVTFTFPVIFKLSEK